MKLVFRILWVTWLAASGYCAALALWSYLPETATPEAAHGSRLTVGTVQLFLGYPTTYLVAFGLDVLSGITGKPVTFLSVSEASPAKFLADWAVLFVAGFLQWFVFHRAVAVVARKMRKS